MTVTVLEVHRTGSARRMLRGPTEVVEALPLGQPLLQIDIALVAQELIELLLIRAMGALDLPVQLGVRGLM